MRRSARVAFAASIVRVVAIEQARLRLCVTLRSRAAASSSSRHLRPRTHRPRHWCRSRDGRERRWRTGSAQAPGRHRGPRSGHRGERRRLHTTPSSRVAGCERPRRHGGRTREGLPSGVAPTTGHDVRPRAGRRSRRSRPRRRRAARRFRAPVACRQPYARDRAVTPGDAAPTHGGVELGEPPCHRASPYGTRTAAGV